MKRIGLIIAIMIIAFSGCAPSEKEKNEARELMVNIRNQIDSMLQSESVYVSNLRFIVKEMQVPGIEKDKLRARNLRDSCSQMKPYLETLEITIKKSEESIRGLKEKNND